MKLGGSVITDKARARTFRGRVTARLARELSLRREKTILVHGAGSFGHHEAKRHRIAEGYRSERQVAALPRLYRDLRSLNLKVLDRLIDAGLLPVSIPPYSVARRTSSGKVTMNLQPFESALKLAMLPVSFGDVIRDDKTVFSILSGDTVVERLADHFRPKLAVFVTDVDGIYDRSPKDPEASLILEAHAKTLRRLKLDGSSKTDVTRGMAGKAMEMARIAERGCRVVVVNGNKPGRLKAVLSGKETVATEIHA